MKVFASLLILASASACLAFSVNQATNSVSRRDFFNGVATAGVAATIALAQPSPAMAKENTPLPPINGIYSDPNHKKGYRVVRAVNKSTAVVTLQDEPTGPIITVNGKISTSKKSGTTIKLDLSPKGGPKDVVATLDGSDKLVFPDGNVWTKFPGADGIYADPNHPAGYRVVRIAKGGKVYITLQDAPKGEVIELEGKRSGKGLVIDFSPKGGPKNLAASVKDGQLVFPDGNAWTKM